MKRLISLFLSVVLVIMMFPVMPVSAANGFGVSNIPTIAYTDTSSVASWSARFDSLLSGWGVISDIPNAMLWEAMDNSMSKVVPGSKDSLKHIYSSVSSFNRWWMSAVNLILNQTVPYYDSDSCKIDVDIGFDDILGVYRPYDKNTGLPLVNSLGQFPYYKPVTTDSETGGEKPDPDLGGQWILKSKVKWTKVNVLSEYNLYSIGSQLKSGTPDNDIGTHDNKYYYIGGKWADDSSGDHYVYCDGSGRPYVARVEEKEWSQNSTNNYYTEVTEEGDTTINEGDTIYNTGDTIENQLIDNSTNTVWFPDGTLNYIDELIYDESTKTYYVDAHEEYDLTNNTYITNKYEYEYHINYTSVTYIGTTAEYDEVYEFYYELPDGRSSADLTAEELQVLNTQIDVLPYIRSADDTSIRALYHFDGDTLDSSYWSLQGDFKWNTGSSITYMDSGAFNGALYLDERAHEFVITLPTNVSFGDFTLQFRYYQSATETPVNDSFISVGGLNVMRMDGKSLYRGGGDYLTDVGVGSWQEIAIVRKNGSFYHFLNGVKVGTGTGTAFSPMADKIVFSFGNQQQTYKYIDELRFTDKALYTESGYTPTSVPYDTNLALVLPDTQVPVADEYWTFNSSQTNLLSQYGLADWSNHNSDAKITISSSLSVDTYATDGTTKYATDFRYAAISSSSSLWASYNAQVLTIESGLGTRLIPNTAVLGAYCNLGDYMWLGRSDMTTFTSPYSLAMRLWAYDSDQDSKYNFHLNSNTSYTFSMVDADGNIGSITFKTPIKSYDSCSNQANSVSLDFNGYRLTYQVAKGRSSTWRQGLLLITPLSQNPGEFVYLELVEGAETNLTAEFVSSVVAMDKDDLNTPSLAVRTDLDITGYQLGGVRPSLPTKGLAWALIESGRITSLQIYNGQAWESVDGRIWTGTRWIPYYAYDVLLLKDMWDIVESDPTIEPIYTESGFWSWLQNAWAGMISRLDAVLVALDKIVPGEDESSADEDAGWTILDLEEYWVFESSGDNILKTYGLDHWSTLNPLTNVTADTSVAIRTHSSGTMYASGFSFARDWIKGNMASYSPVTLSPTTSENGTRFTPVLDTFGSTCALGDSMWLGYAVGFAGIQASPYSFGMQLWNYSTDYAARFNSILDYSTVYTLSMVAADGSIGSITFTMPAKTYDSVSDTSQSVSLDFNGYRLTYLVGERWDGVERQGLLLITPLVENPGEFVYWELVEGASTDLTADYVVDASNDGDLDVPSLAIRTDIDITGHQFGGSRPVLPEKGTLWVSIDSCRINALQIFNGQTWEDVDGRIWTGERWVPYYAYDILSLVDVWDGTENLDPINSQSGFWAWLQGAWGEMLGKLDQIIEGLGGSGSSGTNDCVHVYSSEVVREPTCTEPGHLTYTCDLCGHAYTELIDATGHDWVTTNTVPDVLDEAGNVVEEGYEELTCSKCDTISRDYGEGPEEVDIFEALGDFIADGITWILDKLEELADSLRSITDSFNSYIEKISGLSGGFPLFFAGFIALIPEDLMNIFWFSVIAFIVLTVWRKWSR